MIKWLDLVLFFHLILSVGIRALWDIKSLPIRCLIFLSLTVHHNYSLKTESEIFFFFLQLPK